MSSKEKKSKKRRDDSSDFVLDPNVEVLADRITQQLAEIKSALYDPDKGVYSRIRDTSDEHAAADENLKLQLVELAAWRDSMTTKIDDAMREIKSLVDSQLTTHDKIVKIETDISSLQKSKARVASFFKWVGVTFGASAVGFLVKMLFDVFK